MSHTPNNTTHPAQNTGQDSSSLNGATPPPQNAGEIKATPPKKSKLRADAGIYIPPSRRGAPVDPSLASLLTSAGLAPPSMVTATPNPVPPPSVIPTTEQAALPPSELKRDETPAAAVQPQENGSTGEQQEEKEAPQESTEEQAVATQEPAQEATQQQQQEEAKPAPEENTDSQAPPTNKDSETETEAPTQTQQQTADEESNKGDAEETPKESELAEEKETESEDANVAVENKEEEDQGDEEDEEEEGTTGEAQEQSKDAESGKNTTPSTTAAAENEGETGGQEKSSDDDDANIMLAPNAPHEGGKKIYGADFLMMFQPLCKEKPENWNEIADILPGAKNVRKSGGSGGGGGRNFRGSKGGGRRGGGGSTPKRGTSKEYRPQMPEVPIPPPDKNTWQPSRRLAAGDDKTIILKKVTFALNKLTLEKFEPLCNEFIEAMAEVKDIETFNKVIDRVFEKAVDEEQFSSMYARLCVAIQKQNFVFEAEDGSKHDFRRLLLNKCQKEFENKAEVQKKLEELSAEDKTVEEQNLRKRVMGNIIFIGELFKLRMLTPKIIHGGVIKTLLPDKPTELDLEALCKLFSTIGKLLDTKPERDAAGKPMMGHYIAQMASLVDNEEYSSRIRYMMRDVLDARANNWPVDQDAPMTLDELKQKQENKRTRTPAKAPLPSSSSGGDHGARRQGGAAAGRRDSLPGTGGSSNNVTNAKSQASAPDEWEVVGSKSGRGAGRRGNDRRQQQQASDSGEWEVAGGRRGARGGGGATGGKGAQQNQQQQQQQQQGGGRRGAGESRPPSSRGGGAGGDRGRQAAQPGAGGGKGNKQTDQQQTRIDNPFSLLSSGESPLPVEKKRDGKKQTNQEKQQQQASRRGGGGAAAASKAATPASSSGVYVPRTRREDSRRADIEVPDFPDDDDDDDLPPARRKRTTSDAERKEQKVQSDIKMLLEEYTLSHDSEEAGQCIKELQSPAHHPQVVKCALRMSVETKQEDRDLLSKLFADLKESEVLTTKDFRRGFALILGEVEQLDEDISPYASRTIGRMIGRAIVDDVITTKFFETPALQPLVPSGKALRIVVEAIRVVAQDMDTEELKSFSQSSNIDFFKFLTEDKRNPEYLATYLKEQLASQADVFISS